MRSSLRFVLALLALALALTLVVSVPLGTSVADEAPDSLDADALLVEVDGYLSFLDSSMRMTMAVHQGGEVQKAYEMAVRRRDAEQVHIEFLAPAREKDRELLRLDNKMWMYLPDLGKSITISARQSFLGSTLSNGDLLQTDLVADYEPTVLRREPVEVGDGESVEAIVLELTAARRGVTYDRILLWARADDRLPLRQEFFTRSGKRIKTMVLGTPKELGGHVLQTEMVVTSELRPNESTVLVIEELATEQNLSPVRFNKESLGRL